MGNLSEDPMSEILIIAVAVCIVIGAVLGLVYLRRDSRTSPLPPPTTVRQEDDDARLSRRRVVDRRGSELIARRVLLEDRQDTLGGDADLSDALDRLERRRRGGEITEQEFEAEKVRLLSG